MPGSPALAPARPPTLASSCARAATAAEARYRIGYPEVLRRESRVIALDEHAAELARRLATSAERWRGGHFLVFEDVAPAGGEARLRTTDGTPALLSQELAGADTVVMLAGAAASSEAAAVIGDACAARSIMSAGLVVPGGGAVDGVDGVVSALRPNAMVLVILQTGDDVAEILSALRV